MDNVRYTPGTYEVTVYLEHKQDYYNALMRVDAEGTITLERPNGEWTTPTSKDNIIRARLLQRA